MRRAVAWIAVAAAVLTAAGSATAKPHHLRFWDGVRAVEAHATRKLAAYPDMADGFIVNHCVRLAPERVKCDLTWLHGEIGEWADSNGGREVAYTDLGSWAIATLRGKCIQVVEPLFVERRPCIRLSRR